MSKSGYEISSKSIALGEVIDEPKACEEVS